MTRTKKKSESGQSKHSTGKVSKSVAALVFISGDMDSDDASGGVDDDVDKNSRLFGG